MPTPIPPRSTSRTTTLRATPPSSSSSRLHPETDFPHTPSGTRRLPTASPPSARLRKLAPTPVKIPPTPPLPPCTSLKTYRQWTAGIAGVGGGSPVKKERKGSFDALTAARSASALDGMAAAGQREEEEELETDDEDPFDLDIQFAAPPTASPLYPSRASAPTNLAPLTAHSPSRLSTNRQSSSATYRTESTAPSFSTSPVLHSKTLSTYTKLPPSSSHGPERSSLPAPGPTGRSRTATSRSSRTIPDVPDEVLDLDELSLAGHGRSRSNRLSAAWSGSDEDARAPTRRTGDELLSPGAFLAAHVPRPVLVQFRDVFGGNDTVSPHLPASVWASPAASPSTIMAGSPGPAPAVDFGDGGRRGFSPTRETTYEPVGSSPRSPAARKAGPSPSGASLAESFATFGVRGRTREESANSDTGSFTFSAYLADDDPVREEIQRGVARMETEAVVVVEGKGHGKGKKKDKGTGTGMTKGKSGRPVPRSNVPVHEPKAPEHRTHTHPRPAPSTAKPTSSSSAIIPSTSKVNITFINPFHSVATVTPELVPPQRDPKWVHPFARPSPTSSDEGDELVTPEQRDQPLGPSLNVGSSTSAGPKPYNPNDFGTPTPTPRSQLLNVGLGLTLDEPTYRRPPSRDPVAQAMHGFFQRNETRPLPSAPKVPKSMREDYQDALEAKKIFGLASDADGHPTALPTYPYPYTTVDDSTTISTPAKSRGPKKFKSLASLRKRLPSSRGAPAPPPPSVPLSASRSGESLLTPVEHVSLTGKPAPSRPGTAVRHVPTSQTIPVAPGESFFDWGGDTPPASGTSAAFSINSMGTGTTLSSLGRVTAAHVVGVRRPVIEQNDDGWTGGLKADLEVDGVKITRTKTMNLWVDQENCREKISTLRPVRWHPPTRTRTRALDRIDGILTEKSTFDDLDEVMDDTHDKGNVFWAEGCVEFGMNPRNRDKWSFTYGALEAFPVLRRVTFDGIQNLDFASRIASLKHRVRGIYAVAGEEKTGARWRFRYMVDLPTGADPKARVIVPLSFYANAAFIRGDHALKLGINHMVRKGWKTHLTSEKIPTPELCSTMTLGPPPSVPAPSRPSTSSSSYGPPPLAVTVRVDTVVDRSATPRQPAARQYRPSTADTVRGGAVAEMGELSPLLPKARAFGMGSAQVSATRSPRPTTAQEPRRNVPLSSLGQHSALRGIGDTTFSPSHPRARPGTADAAFPPSIAQLDQSRVAPSRSNESLTPPADPPRSRIGSAFGRSRALTSGARPSTPLSAPLPPVQEMSNSPAPPTSATKPSFAMRAKKSLSNLRPPSRPGTAGLPISRPVEPPLPTSSSAGLLGLGLEGGRTRTKSSHASLGKGGRPSTAGGDPSNNKPQSASLFSSFAPFRSRPSTAQPPTSAPHTPHRPPTAPSARPLQFGFGSYVNTPPSGVTYSAIGLQQLEQRKTPGALREFYANEMAMGGTSLGSGLGAGLLGPADRKARRPRTAGTDGRGKVSGTMI